jgi:hypothetical protein
MHAIGYFGFRDRQLRSMHLPPIMGTKGGRGLAQFKLPFVGERCGSHTRTPLVYIHTYQLTSRAYSSLQGSSQGSIRGFKIEPMSFCWVGSRDKAPTAVLSRVRYDRDKIRLVVGCDVNGKKVMGFGWVSREVM